MWAGGADSYGDHAAGFPVEANHVDAQPVLGGYHLDGLGENLSPVTEEMLVGCVGGGVDQVPVELGFAGGFKPVPYAGLVSRAGAVVDHVGGGDSSGVGGDGFNELAEPVRLHEHDIVVDLDEQAVLVFGAGEVAVNLV